MKIYLVGGAVRDQLLGYPVSERDWVVVGATSAQLLHLGYRQVGSDFPVFIHPKTGEEYALARTERKSGLGYYGFDCNFDATVTLEDDLLRRDLTINAMAMDENNQLIDPYNGLTDLKEKTLRHVSAAFVEDPVRVLRVARFLARYSHLGFHLADETRLLMYKMVKNGELDHLVPERVWQEWQRSLLLKNPEVFITTLRSCGALAIISPEIEQLFGVPNPPQYHAEIDSGVHTLLVLQAAVRLSTDPKVRFAALVHDLGKGLTPMALWPKQHGHEQRGIALIESLCERLRIPVDYRELAVLVSCYHLMIHRFHELKPATLVSLLEKTDAFRRPQRFFDLLIACEADAQGCGRTVDYQQRVLWQKVYETCAKISAQECIAQGYEGKAIKEALHQARVSAVKLIKL
ncbi:MAG: multifunctional CCA tRNA nucleotidyl transferase/2'3'-cyclic phosphodiesterase/2'nucleotidase/phosphatase [Legionellales bacterium RIFCSPHIGHO2_12_FULL_42_9]|nr:MAG: multifunctional CCA tRNA nucleotidyl transferase/2'3'-cyclic phosphodiesterase/2'nucleotidase/phosphatase [Legionellales bacterium RIFCSPHIGHO2_12_FULL_42_9]